MKILVFVVSAVLAFLLFAVQPMATKMVLPTLGGTPAVWNTAMFTFQLLLLAAYAYAHGLVAALAPRWQWRLHAVFVAASFLLLPLAVSLPTSDAMLAHPIPYLIAALVFQLGLPFFVLAATQPLLQAWLSRSQHPLAQTPYVLYSASNLGSFAGLMGYVALVEPMLKLPQQSFGWSWLYVMGTAMLLAIGWRLRPAHNEAVTLASAPPTRRQCLAWIGLAFLPSSLSLGVTTYITTDVASVPLLWVMPLALYLLSFVDAFRERPWLAPLCQRIAPLLGLVALILYGLQGHRFAFGFPFHLVTFGIMAFALHGWLARLRPVPAHLTRFYLCLSIGGALGGALNGLVAPLVLREALEYPVVLLVASITAFMLAQRATGEGWITRQLTIAAQVILLVLGLTAMIYLALSFIDNQVAANLAHLNSQTLMMSASMAATLSLLIQRRFVKAFYACVAVILVMLLSLASGVVGFTTLYKDRNFFGVERVYENPALQARYIMHDTTLHGTQSLIAGEETLPLSYYGAIGDLFTRLPVMHAQPMAAVGLGIGSVKCHAVEGQRVDFFEINPMVKQLAEDTRYFQQLRDCPGTYRVLLGDGRIRLAEQPDGTYGTIILDAFSSDAIPAHLLTQEAMALYLRKLAPGGVLLLHTTNRHLDLWPLIGAHADAMGVVAHGRFFPADRSQRLQLSSYWVIMARTADDTAAVTDDERWRPLHGTGERVWTDHYTNLLPYLKAWR